MADGFTVQIDEEMARQLERAAEAAGMSREDYARFLLGQHLLNPNDYTWVNGDPLTDDTPATAWEDGRPWEEVETEMRALLAERLGKTP